MKRWVIFGLFAVVWTVLLLLPGKQYSRAGLEEWPATFKTLVTKSIHVVAYVLFAVLAGWLGVAARYRWLPLYFLMAHAVLTEVMQQYVEGRTGTLEDSALNHAGILLGILVSWRWWTKP